MVLLLVMFHLTAVGSHTGVRSPWYAACYKYSQQSRGCCCQAAMLAVLAEELCERRLLWGFSFAAVGEIK